MDWGVFHVEHGFFTAWQRFRKALLQRNAALKAKQKTDVCQLWNNELNNTANHIDTLRQQYFKKLTPYLEQLIVQFFVNETVDINYKRGWSSNRELYELLDENLVKDRMKGYTNYGPHRAEITIKVNSQSAQTCISRGQQKTLVALMRLAQAMQFTEASQKSCVLLYDDLSAELDSSHRAEILSVLSTMNIQLFLTAIEQHQIDLSDWSDKMMFHVKHGVVTS
jgi:DNA replication and repair protein RecF